MLEYLLHSWLYWLQTPVRVGLLIVACHELRVIRYSNGERRVYSHYERGTEIVGSCTLCICTFVLTWINMGTSLAIPALAFALVVLMHTCVVLRRVELDDWKVVYNRVRIAEGAVYSALILFGGTMLFFL